MTSGYVRQSAGNIVTGHVIAAADLNAEFNQLQAAFDAFTGHNHDGTVGGGQPINASVFTGSSVAGTANAITVGTTSPGTYSLMDGNLITVTPPNINTGATTLNVKGTGALPIYKASLSGLVPLAAGDIGGFPIIFQYSATAGGYIGLSIILFGYETTVSSNQAIGFGSGLNMFVATANCTFTVDATSTLTKWWYITIFAENGTVTLTPNAADAINSGTTGASLTISKGSFGYLYTDAAGNLYFTATSTTSLPSLTTVGTITTGTWNATVIAGQYGGTGVANTGKTITLGGNVSTAGALTHAGAFTQTFTATGNTSVTLPTSGTLVGSADTGTVTNTMLAGGITNAKLAGSITASNLVLTDITTLSGLTTANALTSASTLATVGTIGTGVWQGTVVAGQYGGTGVANTGKTITIGGNVTHAGAFTTTLTVTANTSVTLPTTGTLVNTAVTTLGSLTSASTLATIGTITTGVWNGTAVGAQYGGTGQNFSASTGIIQVSSGTFSASNSLPASLTIATPNITGVTNGGDATAGSIGEYVASSVASGSAVSLSNATPVNVTTISLTAGDWDVTGSVIFTGAGGTQTQEMIGGINTTTATLPTNSTTNPGSANMIAYTSNWNPLGFHNPNITLGTTRISISTTTTVYLVAQAAFTPGSLSAYGMIRARRIR